MLIYVLYTAFMLFDNQKIYSRMFLIKFIFNIVFLNGNAIST